MTRNSYEAAAQELFVHPNWESSEPQTRAFNWLIKCAAGHHEGIKIKLTKAEKDEVRLSITYDRTSRINEKIIVVPGLFTIVLYLEDVYIASSIF